MPETAPIPSPYLTSIPPVKQPLTNGDATPLRALCASLNAQVTAFLAEDVKTERLKSAQAQTRISLQIIQEALDNYPLSAISISYNGGKDCLLLLVLLLSILHTHPALPPLLPAIYISPPFPFSAVDDFVESSSAAYHLALARYSQPTMREAFADYLAHNDRVEAIFVGTRRTDPHGGRLGSFQRTDGGWPGFMRVHPVIEWRYGEVWAFLRHLNIPYCELYDQGYTSLGGTTDTHPNPALQVVSPAGEPSYRPAHELEDEELERLGRDW